MTLSEGVATAEPPAVPLPRISGFVRQLTHDVRNTLNSIDLQAAYLLELVSDPEATEELRRMRSLISSSARQLQGLSANFWATKPNVIPYQANILVEDFQDRMQKTSPEQAARIDWEVSLGNESVSVDIEMLFTALQRLFENAIAFATPESRLQARVFAEGETFILELRQQSPAAPATDPDQWGREPFVSTRRGAYGLGLFRARSLLEVHGAQLSFAYDSGSNLLLTRVSLPFAPLHESASPIPNRHY